MTFLRTTGNFWLVLKEFVVTIFFVCWVLILLVRRQCFYVCMYDERCHNSSGSFGASNSGRRPRIFEEKEWCMCWSGFFLQLKSVFGIVFIRKAWTRFCTRATMARLRRLKSCWTTHFLGRMKNFWNAKTWCVAVFFSCCARFVVFFFFCRVSLFLCVYTLFDQRGNHAFTLACSSGDAASVRMLLDHPILGNDVQFLKKRNEVSVFVGLGIECDVGALCWRAFETCAGYLFFDLSKSSARLVGTKSVSPRTQSLQSLHIQNQPARSSTNSNGSIQKCVRREMFLMLFTFSNSISVDRSESVEQILGSKLTRKSSLVSWNIMQKKFCLKLNSKAKGFCDIRVQNALQFWQFTLLEKNRSWTFVCPTILCEIFDTCTSFSAKQAQLQKLLFFEINVVHIPLRHVSQLAGFCCVSTQVSK